mmetsp:Transcript_28947/g.66276  ORF Transcript_28947/g.66276 Transcript_28947/m.66276 type:complete len:211 (-) Transcript_28947:520-1152(-)
MEAAVEVTRTVVRTRVMSSLRILKGPSCSSSANSRTFHGYSVVMAISAACRSARMQNKMPQMIVYVFADPEVNFIVAPPPPPPEAKAGRTLPKTTAISGRAAANIDFNLILGGSRICFPRQPSLPTAVVPLRNNFFHLAALRNSRSGVDNPRPIRRREATPLAHDLLRPPTLHPSSSRRNARSDGTKLATAVGNSAEIDRRARSGLKTPP